MYKIIGADGKAYGPVSAEQIRLWIAESRVNAQTQIQAEGSQDWRPLSDFPEFATTFAGPEAPIAPSLPGVQMPNLRDAAARSLKGPAIGLRVFAVLLILGTAASMVQIFKVMGGGATESVLGPGAPRIGKEFHLALLIGAAILNVAIIAMSFIGASKMERLQSYGLAMTACILAMLPCSACCLIGLPVGIWGLVVLNQANVKSQFT